MGTAHPLGEALGKNKTELNKGEIVGGAHPNLFFDFLCASASLREICFFMW